MTEELGQPKGTRITGIEPMVARHLARDFSPETKEALQHVIDDSTEVIMRLLQNGGVVINGHVLSLDDPLIKPEVRQLLNSQIIAPITADQLDRKSLPFETNKRKGWGVKEGAEKHLGYVSAHEKGIIFYLIGPSGRLLHPHLSNFLNTGLPPIVMNQYRQKGFDRPLVSPITIVNNIVLDISKSWGAGQIT